MHNLLFHQDGQDGDFCCKMIIRNRISCSGTHIGSRWCTLSTCCRYHKLSAIIQAAHWMTRCWVRRPRPRRSSQWLVVIGVREPGSSGFLRVPGPLGARSKTVSTKTPKATSNKPSLAWLRWLGMASKKTSKKTFHSHFSFGKCWHRALRKYFSCFCGLQFSMR